MFNPKTVPVFRVRKWRGGGYGFHRWPQTYQEHRLNQCIDSGEPQARSRRGRRMLVDAWNELPRCVQRTWKVQGKRRKAWDR